MAMAASTPLTSYPYAGLEVTVDVTGRILGPVGEIDAASAPPLRR